MVIDGIEVRRDAYGRYSLNDLPGAAGGEQKPPKYCSPMTKPVN